MNSKKQRELLIENGELQIRVRALSDRLAAADTKLKNQTANLAVLLVAFKQYIRQTHAVENAPLSEGDVLAILNKQVAEAAKQCEAIFQKETAQ